MLKPGSGVGRLLHGSVIVIAAPVASMGVTLGCFIRNLVFYPAVFDDSVEHRMPGTGLGDFAGTVLFAVLGLIWLAALGHFILTAPKSPLTLIPAALAFAIFGYASWQSWLMAYPVCNPF